MKELMRVVPGARAEHSAPAAADPGSSSLANRDWIRAFAVMGAVTVDATMLIAAALFATFVRWGDVATDNAFGLLALFLPPYLLVGVLVYAYDLDVLRSGFRTVTRAALALLAAAAIGFAVAFALQVSGRLSRIETALMLTSGFVFLSAGRTIGWRWLRNMSSAIDPLVFVMGDDTAVHQSSGAHTVINVRHLGWRPDGADPDFLDSVARTFIYADRVVLVFSNEDERNAWGAFMRLTGVNAEVFEPRLATMAPVDIGRWADSPTLVVSRGPLGLQERVMKRSLDLVLIFLALPVVVPLVAILAMLVKMETAGPAFFVQDRVGRQNSRYKCFKLRTMRTETTDAGGGRSASRNDDRVTRLGRFLRRTSLDELPQLWNVVVGDMSLVGPRPHALRSTAEGAPFWEVVQSYWTRHAVKPGITGLAQVQGLRGATLTRQDIRARVEADLEYINTWSLWLDIRILMQTLRVIVHRNAF